MKKVLIITAVSGFLMKFLSEDVKTLQSMGYEVHYASNGRHPVYQYEESAFQEMHIHFHHIDIEQSPGKVIQNYKALKQLEEIIRQEQINLIHCHTPVGGLLGRLAGKRYDSAKMKVIYTVHGFHFYKGCNKIKYALFYQIERFLARYTDAVVTINREDYEAAAGFRLKKHGRVYQLPGVGINRKDYKLVTEDERKNARKELQIEDNFFIVSIGEVRRNKNQEIILRALAYLQEEGVDITHIRYGIVGEGMYKKRLAELAEQLHVKDKLIFYGYCQDVRQYLRAADISAFPSVREGLGMAALESLSMGVPVLAADNRGTREYMRMPENGLVYDAFDIKGFADGIRQMVKEKHLWNQEAKKKKIRDSIAAFDISCSKKKMELIYEQTIN